MVRIPPPTQLNVVMKKIKWKKSKGGRAFEHLLEGYVDDKLAFMVEGRLCVTDLRPTKLDEWRPPKHYRLNSEGPNPREEGKQIAYELLNNINLEKHNKNWENWISEERKTIDIIKEAEEFLKKIREKN